MIYKFGNVYFREILPRDLEPLRIMHNDPKTLSMLTDPTQVTKGMQKKWYESLKASLKSKRYAYCIKSNGKEILLGMIRFDQIDKINRNMLVGMDVIPNLRGQGYGSLGFKLILDYCFNRLRMHKATLYTADYNKVAINLYKKFGFKKEGILKEHLLKSGKYYDLYVMSLFERDYKRSR